MTPASPRSRRGPFSLLALVVQVTGPQWRHHPWRHLTAALAVMLGVALAFSVHLINASALSEFASAVRSVSGEADLQIRAAQGPLDEKLYERLSRDPAVALASPVLQIQTYAVLDGERRLALQVVGLDALVAASVSPSLMPQAAPHAPRLALLMPGQVFVSAAAERALGLDAARPGQQVRLQAGLAVQTLDVAGRVPGASGPPLIVMDVAAAQDLFGRGGELSRIDLRLQPGVGIDEWLRAAGLPAGIQALRPDQDSQRASQLSRAYRVNLTVLALVALFTGAFLVFSVLSLGVTQRTPQLALLAVMGLTGRERTAMVMAEALLLGLLGSVAGLILGTSLAWLALRFLGGDLGGGYFPGVAPSLAFSVPAALLYGALGLVAAAVGAGWPARMAGTLPAAQALKGAGWVRHAGNGHRWLGVASAALMVTGGLLALSPPIAGLPLAAYVSVALLLLGGVTALPALIAVSCELIGPRVRHAPLALLALERARRVQGAAAVAVSGVVAALSLSVALTVMVASFRGSVMDWLDRVLPADLYVRTASHAAAGDTVYFPAETLDRIRDLPGVDRASGLRTVSVLIDPARPSIALISRPVARAGGAAAVLPLVGDGAIPPLPPGAIPVWVSEAMVDLHGARIGQPLPSLSAALAPGRDVAFIVAGVWRDYARQFGAVVMDETDYRSLTGDTRINDLALWLAEAARPDDVQRAVRELLVTQAGPQAGMLLEFASSADIRALSLRIFDRSFAVTYWLQAVAIGIGLFGVAASFSAQVLSRRKEFGLLTHLGLTRRQILGVVAGEGLVWSSVGALAGVLLGLLLAVVLVHVVNPQSFHWTMDLAVPGIRLVLLCVMVIVAGTLTAWLAGRQAASRDAVRAVKEDW